MLERAASGQPDPEEESLDDELDEDLTIGAEGDIDERLLSELLPTTAASSGSAATSPLPLAGVCVCARAPRPSTTSMPPRQCLSTLPTPPHLTSSPPPYLTNHTPPPHLIFLSFRLPTSHFRYLSLNSHFSLSQFLSPSTFFCSPHPPTRPTHLCTGPPARPPSHPAH
jgi:hypothetical protein